MSLHKYQNNRMANKKLQKEIEWLESLKNDFIMGDNNEIYDRLSNIAKGKYSKDDKVAEFQENFFADFILNAEEWADGANYNLYNSKLHKRLLAKRRKVDPGFLHDVDENAM